MTTATEPLVADLVDLGVLDRSMPLPTMEPLEGGVSSDIWLVDVPGGPVVVKRALARLKVTGDWQAPLSRTGYEVAWMRRAEAICPGVTPRIIASNPRMFVMEYLDPNRHRLWKRDLLGGRADAAVAAALAQRLVAIHAATTADADVSDEFDNVDVFTALRLDPYFAATATRQPALTTELDGLCRSYLANRKALVHGDVSPKNILVGPDGPVLLDAECATWGDPAFDVAFCTTHLLLKMVAVPHTRGPLADSVEELRRTYHEGITWEEPHGFWLRCAATTAGLLLARVDGLSPVEYLDTQQQAVVRTAASHLLSAPPATIPDLVARWMASVDGDRNDA